MSMEMNMAEENKMFKVYEVKAEEELNDRYFENYESAKENIEHRLSEMIKSDYFVEFEKIPEDEFMHKTGEPIKEMYHIFAKTKDGDYVLTILMMRDRSKNV